MNSKIFARLLWKEFRQQRAFWLAMLFLTAFLMVMFEVSLTLFDVNPHKHSIHSGQIFIFVILYALGCGATLFASEHDTGTYAFLRNLPVEGFSVFLAKVTLALFATASLACVLYFPTYFLVGCFYDEVQIIPWHIWCLGLGLALGWSSLFSLLLKRPLLAAFLGGAVGCPSFFLVAHLTDKWHSKTEAIYYPAYWWLLAALCIANIWLGSRWFRNRSPKIKRLTAKWGLSDSAFDAASDENMGPPRTSTILRRLVWQQWRFSRLWMGLFVSGFFVLLLLLAFALTVNRENLISGNRDHFELMLTVIKGYALFFCWCITISFGVMVFHGDQRMNSVRFLAERAARPWHVWLSRQAVWAAPLLMVGLGLFLVCFFYYVDAISGIRSGVVNQLTWPETVWYCLWHFWHGVFVWSLRWVSIVAVIFAAGQLCSMLFRSGLLAAVFGIALGGFFAWWVAIITWLGISPIWSVLPIAVGLFLATFLLTPDWMRGRPGWRPYLRPAAVVLVPIVAIVVATPFYRVYSISDDGPGFDVAQYDRPETEAEKTTVSMYREACEHIEHNPFGKGSTGMCPTPYDLLVFWNLKVHPREKKSREALKTEAKTWIKQNEKAIELALAASQRESCGKLDSSPAGFPPVATLAYLLTLDGHRLTGAGKLDLAADRYFAALRIATHIDKGSNFHAGEIIEVRAYEGLRYWSAAPGQTVERIKAAIKTIDSIAKARPAGEEAVKSYYMQARSKIESEDKSDLAVYMRHWTDTLFYTLPWEKARLLRLLNRTASGDLNALKNMDDPVDNNAIDNIYETLDSQTFPKIDYLDFERRSLPGSLREPARVRGISLRVAFHELNARTVRRATKIVLALEAWKLEHGELPESLDELVGPYFKELPKAPRAGTVFAYFPKGLPKRLSAYSPSAEPYFRDENNYLFARQHFGPKLPLLLVCNRSYEQTGGRENGSGLENNGFAFHIP